MKANFIGGPNPVPVKAALSLMGLTSDMVRLPLLPLEEAHRARLRLVLETAGALSSAGRALGGSAGGMSGEGAPGDRSEALRRTAGHRPGNGDGRRVTSTETGRSIRAMMAT